jgi:hypothetical protein
VFLAEAIKEKVYIEESICKVRNRILWLSVAINESDYKLNKELVDNKLEELDKLYKDYQKYVIIITRAKAKVRIKLNEGEFSIADAENLVGVLKNKLEFFNSLTGKAEGLFDGPSNTVCIDMKDLDKQIELLRQDVRTMEMAIDRAAWGVEI